MDIRRREYIKHKILGVLFIIMAAVSAAFTEYGYALLMLLFAVGALTAKEEDFDNE